MKKLCNILFVMVLFTPVWSHAQTNEEVENRRLQIHSPQVAEMIRYNNFGEMNENTGQLNLSIDLIHWSDPDFELPVRLKYTSSGFKPNAQDNYVGRDWMLECGGIIHREINGLPDDHRIELVHKLSGLQYQYGFLRTIMSKDKDNAELESQMYSNIENCVTSLPETRIPVFVTDRSQEVSSDTYYFSFGKHSGKFMINFDGTVNVVSFSGGKFKVDLSNYFIQTMSNPDDDYESEIRIITDDGYTYCFGGSYDAVEYLSYTWTSRESPLSAANTSKFMQANKVVAWGLKKVIAPNLRTLIFNYKHLPPQYCNQPWTLLQFSDECIEQGYHQCFSLQCSPFYRSDYTISLLASSNEPIWFDTNGSFIPESGVDFSINKIMLIESIETDDKRVEFSYSDRDESAFAEVPGMPEFGLKCGAKLDAVVLKNASKQIERSDLSYMYYSNRMFLEKLSNSRNGTYKFFYDANSNSSLPVINTTDIDFWGYYRAIPNEHFIPAVENASDLANYHRLSYRGSDRCPLIDTPVSLSLLKRVSFPTGGTMEITYEPHTFSAMLVQEPETDFYPTIKKLSQTKLGGGARVKSIRYLSDGEVFNHVNYVYNQDINSTESSGTLMYLPRFYHFNRTHCQFDGQSRCTDVVNSQGFNRTTYASDYIRYSTITRMDINSYHVTPDSVYAFSITPLEECTQPISRVVYVGRTVPGRPDWPDLERNYAQWRIYGNSYGAGEAYAKILQNGQTIREYRFTEYKPGHQYIFNPIDELGSGTYTVQLFKTGNAWVTFECMYPHTGTEYIDRDGYIVSKYSDYTTNPDLYTNAYSYRTAPYFVTTNYTLEPERDTMFFKNYFLAPESRTVERSKLLSQSVYDKNDVLLQRTDYEYATPGFDRYSVYIASPNTVNNVQLNMYSHPNKERMYTCLPSRITTTTYWGTDSLQTVNTIQYDQYGYSTVTTRQNSDGTTEENSVKRILDEPGSSGIYGAMKDLNLVGLIRSKQKTFISNGQKLLDKLTVCDYDYFSNQIVPQNSKVTEHTGAKRKVRIEYLAYDDYGNPLHVIENGSQHVTYIWSYLGKYPVAKIENATNDEVASALSTPLASLSSQAQPDMQALDGLREALPKARIWTYTYIPSIGLRSATDPSGQTTFYAYDEAGRLSQTGIRGEHGDYNITEDYKYHIVNK